jgi:predicted TIM-barrel enzyme
VNKVHERFGKPRALLPVIHCINSHQTEQQSGLALRAGADGVFLINQGGMDEVKTLMTAVAIFRGGVPFVGVNLLVRDVPWRRSFARSIAHTSALWTDSTADIAGFCRWRSAIGAPDLLLFGGVAFKYQPGVADVGAAAHDAALAGVDVVTTSGPGTGEQPTVEKVRTMRQALGDHALAVASGITPENVAPFLPHVDAFLVATGIEHRFGYLEPSRVRALADAIHGWRP